VRDRALTRFEFEPRSECVCGSPLANGRHAVTKAFAAGDVRFTACPSCGSWCQSPIVSAQTLARWIDSQEYQGSRERPGVAYADYAADENNRIVEARGRYARDLAPILKPGSRVLEIGCASGSLLSVIRSHGHPVTGVDLSASFAQAAKSLHDLKVRVGDFLDLELPLRHFDAVLAIGTVSNFRDLARCLARCRELLAPGGALVFNFPDADSRWVRLVYRDRSWMFTPSVSTFMTARGCIGAVSRAGFEGIRVAQDVQRPSLRKLLHHGRAGFLLRAMAGAGLADARLPIALPAPSVRLLIARAPAGIAA
jgi:SAM-dependent methyltransferase